jgi:hypothetical protein
VAPEQSRLEQTPLQHEETAVTSSPTPEEHPLQSSSISPRIAESSLPSSDSEFLSLSLSLTGSELLKQPRRQKHIARQATTKQPAQPLVEEREKMIQMGLIPRSEVSYGEPTEDENVSAVAGDTSEEAKNSESPPEQSPKKKFVPPKSGSPLGLLAAVAKGGIPALKKSGGVKRPEQTPPPQSPTEAQQIDFRSVLKKRPSATQMKAQEEPKKDTQ